MVLAFQLLEPAQQNILKKQIEEIEDMVLEKEFQYNYYRCKSCKYKFKTKIDWFDIKGCPKCKGTNITTLQERHSLYDIEMAMESNRDYTAFFMRYGERISKFDIERRLSRIKSWLFSIIRERSESRRFKRFR